MCGESAGVGEEGGEGEEGDGVNSECLGAPVEFVECDVCWGVGGGF